MTEVRQNIISASYTFQPSDIWDNVSDCAKEFIKCILVTDPSKRPNVSDNSSKLSRYLTCNKRYSYVR